MMKPTDKIREEIEALQRLAAQCPDDEMAQASIAGQVNVLEWLASTVTD